MHESSRVLVELDADLLQLIEIGPDRESYQQIVRMFRKQDAHVDASQRGELHGGDELLIGDEVRTGDPQA